MALPSSNLSFSVCSTEMGNATPVASDNLSASVLFYNDWTAPNGIYGYGQQQASGNNRIANVPVSSQVNLSDYLGLTVVGNDEAIGNGAQSYWTYWDNSLPDPNDVIYDLYFRLKNSGSTNTLVSENLGALSIGSSVGYTNIGYLVPLVHYAYWQVEFTTGKPATSPFDFEILCSTDEGTSYTSVFNINQNWTNSTTYTFTWNDGGGNLSVETASPTCGYLFQMLFY
jgi:hypothetical protein